MSNKTLYWNLISQQLAGHAQVVKNRPDYALCHGELWYQCIDKFFGDLFEKLVFAIFDDEKRSE